MAYPTTSIDTQHMDAGTDSPKSARADIKQMADHINDMVADKPLHNVSEDTTPTLGGELDANSNKIVNVTDPTANQDAATKAYVDDELSTQNERYRSVVFELDSYTASTDAAPLTNVTDPDSQYSYNSTNETLTLSAGTYIWESLPFALYTGGGSTPSAIWMYDYSDDSDIAREETVALSADTLYFARKIFTVSSSTDVYFAHPTANSQSVDRVFKITKYS